MGTVSGWNVFDYVIDPRWEPELPAGVLLALIAVVTLTLALLVIPPLIRRAPSEPGPARVAGASP